MTSGWLATPGIVFPLAMVVAMSPMAVVPAVLLVLHTPAPKRSARVPIVIGSGLLVRLQHCGKVRRVGVYDSGHGGADPRDRIDARHGGDSVHRPGLGVGEGGQRCLLK
jgi:hypothetical protein